MEKISVMDFGAAGNGIDDDFAAFQKALDSGASSILSIPPGTYRITGTLKVSSGTTIKADPAARIFLCGEVRRKRGDFLLSNRDPEKGNTDIRISGGVWDGNNFGRFNTKPEDLFDPQGCSGALLNFCNVRNLTLENMELTRPVVYFLRMCKLDRFTLRNLVLSGKRTYNQDGLHFGGEVRNGLIENIRALDGQSNDDLLALNADDSMRRLENLDLVCGPIENLHFRNIFAEDCYSAIRMLSIHSPIRNIVIENLTCGCRNLAINMDAARYCRTPLFKDADHPDGIGAIENIRIDGMTVHSTWAETSVKALLLCETRAKNFRIEHFKRDLSRDAKPDLPTLFAAKAPGMSLTFSRSGETVAGKKLANKEDTFTYNEPFDQLVIN